MIISIRKPSKKEKNYIIKEIDMGSRNWFIGVSRIQCEIIKLSIYSKTGAQLHYAFLCLQMQIHAMERFDDFLLKYS